MQQIKQVVIWGHKLHSHTHSYIHNGFFIAFKSLGYKTFWFDDSDNVVDFDFKNTLFITEHQVNKKIPLCNDCLYLTHYIDECDYVTVPKENIIMLKVSLRDFVEKDDKNCIYKQLNYGNKHEYYSKINGYNCLYMYWATDLLPEEINVNINNINNIKLSNEINFIGSTSDVSRIMQQLCHQNNIKFNKYGGTFNVNSTSNVSVDNNVKLIQNSLISPALQDESQIKCNYIPCRIFKNISYGKMGITNNPIVNDLFDNKLIYDNDLVSLLNKGFEFETRSDKKNTIVKLMEHVRDNHTYINRIKTIINYISEYTSFVL